MKTLLISSTLSIILFVGCNEKAQPYEERNESISITQEQGKIQTH